MVTTARGCQRTKAPSGAVWSSAGVGSVRCGPALRTVTSVSSTPGRTVANEMSSRSTRSHRQPRSSEGVGRAAGRVLGAVIVSVMDVPHTCGWEVLWATIESLEDLGDAAAEAG